MRIWRQRPLPGLPAGYGRRRLRQHKKSPTEKISIEDSCFAYAFIALPGILGALLRIALFLALPLGGDAFAVPLGHLPEALPQNIAGIGNHRKAAGVHLFHVLPYLLGLGPV